MYFMDFVSKMKNCIRYPKNRFFRDQYSAQKPKGITFFWENHYSKNWFLINKRIKDLDKISRSFASLGI